MPAQRRRSTRLSRNANSQNSNSRSSREHRASIPQNDDDPAPLSFRRPSPLYDSSGSYSPSPPASEHSTAPSTQPEEEEEEVMCKEEEMKEDERYRLRIALRRSRRDTSEKLAIALHKVSEKDEAIWEMEQSQLRALDTEANLRLENAELMLALERAREIIIAQSGGAQSQLPLRPLSPILDSSPHEMIRPTSLYGEEWLEEDYPTRNIGRPMPADSGAQYARETRMESPSEVGFGGATPDSFMSDF